MRWHPGSWRPLYHTGIPGPSRGFSWAGSHTDFSLCCSLLPQQVPWGLGGSEPGWTAPTVWFPQTPEPGWKGDLQGGGSLWSEGLGKCLASCGDPPLNACQTPAWNPLSHGEKERGSVLVHSGCLMGDREGEKGPVHEDMGEKRGRRHLCGFIRWCVPLWVIKSQGVCVCVIHRDRQTIIETRTSRLRAGVGGAVFFLSWVRERGLCRALFPVVHSCGDLVTPVPSQPVS